MVFGASEGRNGVQQGLFRALGTFVCRQKRVHVAADKRCGRH